MMSSPERELLKRTLASLDKLEPHSDVIYILCKRIQELLAQPEPLGKEIKVPCGSTDYMFGFKDGVLYAEKEHGIGVNNEKI
jgi:hypothetical protein